MEPTYRTRDTIRSVNWLVILKNIYLFRASHRMILIGILFLVTCLAALYTLIVTLPIPQRCNSSNTEPLETKLIMMDTLRFVERLVQFHFLNTYFKEKLRMFQNVLYRRLILKRSAILFIRAIFPIQASTRMRNINISMTLTPFIQLPKFTFKIY